MPILISKRCYRTFARAVAAIRRRRRWGKARASAYVAVIERRQRGSARVRKICRKAR